MSSQSQTVHSPQRILVVTAEGIGPSQDQHGNRLAEALRSLGLVVDVGNLSEPMEESYDWCACTDGVSLEEIQRHCQTLGIDYILDVGFHDRSASVAPSLRSHYHFIPNGLTPSEREAVNSERMEGERPIPWVFVGHAAARRVALLNSLITRVDPCGFVFMPHLNQDVAQTASLFNQRQYVTVLRKSRYHIYYSPHQPFYLESDCFRQSLLAGGVPIKIVPEDIEKSSSLPFDYLVLRETKAAATIRQFNFLDIRCRFIADFLSLPSLTAGLAEFLASISLLPSSQASQAKPQAA